MAAAAANAITTNTLDTTEINSLNIGNGPLRLSRHVQPRKFDRPLRSPFAPSCSSCGGSCFGGSVTEGKVRQNLFAVTPLAASQTKPRGVARGLDCEAASGGPAHDYPVQ